MFGNPNIVADAEKGLIKMNIALIICIPITALVVGFLVLKSVNLGLKWQMQVKENKEPELKSVFTPVVEAVQTQKAENQTNAAKQIMDEWINGGNNGR